MKNRYQLISQEFGHIFFWKEVKESGRTFLQPLMFSKHFHTYLFIESHCILQVGCIWTSSIDFPWHRKGLRFRRQVILPSMAQPDHRQWWDPLTFCPGHYGNAWEPQWYRDVWAWSISKGKGEVLFPRWQCGVPELGLRSGKGLPTVRCHGMILHEVLPHLSPCCAAFSSILCL